MVGDRRAKASLLMTFVRDFFLMYKSKDDKVALNGCRELRLIEAVHEPHVCNKLLDYDIHAERKKSLRYAKGSSETRRTLHALV